MYPIYDIAYTPYHILHAYTPGLYSYASLHDIYHVYTPYIFVLTVNEIISRLNIKSEKKEKKVKYQEEEQNKMSTIFVPRLSSD